MKKIVFTFCILLGTISAYSQSYDGKGDRILNIGYEAYGYGKGVNASFDYGLNKLLSVGGGGSLYFDDEENDYFVYARANLHLGIVFDLPCKLDIYPGFALGYLSSEKVGISGYLGIRYLLSKKVGLFAEVGNNGSIGLSINV